MPRQGDLTGVPLPETVKELDFDQVCSTFHTTPDFIIELISYGTIEPQGTSSTTWRFNTQQLKIIRTAMHLHHDLEVNHAGIALAVDLLEQLNQLQVELDILHKYFER